MTHFEADITQPIDAGLQVRQRAVELMRSLIQSGWVFTLTDDELEEMRSEVLSRLPTDHSTWDEYHIRQAQILSTPEGVQAWGQILCREAAVISQLQQEQLLPTPHPRPNRVQ